MLLAAVPLRSCAATPAGLRGGSGGAVLAVEVLGRGASSAFALEPAEADMENYVPGESM
jgi:hypothetical protein